MLTDVIDYLKCPVCGDRLALKGQAVACVQGHSFDVARQGYVSLLIGSTAPGTADTPQMVAARAGFLAEGHYEPLAERLAEFSAYAGVIVEAGAGTGYYLSRALPRTAAGIALDISKHALKRAARAHPRIGAVVADVWKPLPIADESADILLNVFAPRNPAEFARVLRPGGRLVTVTPAAGHLQPLVKALGLLNVDTDKDRRLEESLAGHFTPAVQTGLEITMRLGRSAVGAIVGMGPSAWHTEPGTLSARIRQLPDPVEVTASFRIASWMVHK